MTPEKAIERRKEILRNCAQRAIDRLEQIGAIEDLLDISMEASGAAAGLVGIEAAARARNEKAKNEHEKKEWESMMRKAMES